VNCPHIRDLKHTMRQVASAKLSVTWDMRSISATSKGAVTRDGRTIRNGTVIHWHHPQMSNFGCFLLHVCSDVLAGLGAQQPMFLGLLGTSTGMRFSPYNKWSLGENDKKAPFQANSKSCIHQWLSTVFLLCTLLSLLSFRLFSTLLALLPQSSHPEMLKLLVYQSIAKGYGTALGVGRNARICIVAHLEFVLTHQSRKRRCVEWIAY
jgi:hypothetical protein